MMLKNKGIIAFFCLFLWSVYFNVAQAEETARQVVEGFQSDLIAVMKQGKELGFKGRYDKLAAPVEKSHDLNQMARMVLGKEWAKLSEKQQQKFVEVFTKYSIASYAYNFKEFAGESFKFDSEEETKRGGSVIHYNFQIPGDKDIRFDYMLKKKGDNWKIISIIAKGVNHLAVQYSEYVGILEKDGFDALIGIVNEKVDNYAKQ